MKRLLAAVLSGWAALACAQYKWIDSEGKTGYGDSPPAGARNVERFSPSAGDAVDPQLLGLPYELRRAAQSSPVLLYTTAQCNACAAARDLLASRGIPYAELTVNSRQDAEEVRRRGLGDLLPVISVGATVVKDPQIDRWNRALDSAGYPRTSQLPRGWQPPPPRPVAPLTDAPAN
jgi:glutaredoxin